MKKIGIILAILLITASGFAQSSVKAFLSEVEDRDDYALVTINREMFKMIASLDLDMGVDEKEIRELVSNIRKLKIYTSQSSANGDFKKLKMLAEESDMASLISIKDGAERVEAFTNDVRDDSIVDGLLVLIKEQDANVFIHLDGVFNLNTLAKLTQKLDIDGFEHLRKVGDRK